MTAPTQAGEDDRPRESRRAKYLSMLAIVVGAGLGLLASTQPWFTIRLTVAANHAGAVTVQGSAAAPALTALSLAGLALAAALAIGGPVVRIILAVLGVVIAACILLSAGVALGGPVVSAESAITAASGVSGGASVSRLVASVGISIWPWVAVLGGIVLAVASVSVVVTSRRWPGPSRRYQTVRFEEPSSATAEQDGDEDGSDEAPVEDEADDTIDRDAAIDRWDELSRGEDPTR